MLITLRAVKDFTGLTNQEVKILSLSMSSFAAFFLFFKSKEEIRC